MEPFFLAIVFGSISADGRKMGAKTMAKEMKIVRNCCRSKRTTLPNCCLCRCWHWNFRVRRRNSAVRAAGQYYAVAETKRFESAEEPRELEAA